MSDLTPSDFELVWDDFVARANAMKFSQKAVLWMTDFYERRLGDEDRKVADAVLRAWLLGDEIGRRFIALALVDDFGIRTALPAVKQLRTRLMDATDPVQVDEREKAERIIGRLGEKESSSR